MKVHELIEELRKIPPYYDVEIGSASDSFGIAKRVIQYDNSKTVEIESDYESDY